MKVLLDTCALIYWQQDPERLTWDAADAIREAEASDGILLSAASAWEVAAKCARGRLELGRSARAWWTRVVRSAGAAIVDLGPEILLSAYELPAWHHQDPFDRIIVATARRLEVPVVTSDSEIRRWEHVNAIW